MSVVFIPTLGPPHSLAAWDGASYAQIATEGYRGRAAGGPSDVAFFPAYPLLGRCLSRTFHFPAATALLMVSHASFMLALIIMSRYLDQRLAAAEVVWSLLGLSLWPTTFFFRMAYSDSLFLLLLLGAMYAMQRNWRPLGVALVTGAATAARPVGLALVPVFLLWLQQRSASWCVPDGNDAVMLSNARRNRHSWQALWLLVLSSWGLIAYMAYQHVAFGDCLAFLKAQSEWTHRSGASPDRELLALVTLEPIWSVFDPTSYAWWRNWDPQANPLLSLQFANPIYFSTTAALVAVGAWKRWLNQREVLLSALLLGIPYVTHSYRAVMMGHGRYAAVVFPAFIVLARFLGGAPRTVVIVFVTACGLLLAAYTAMFVAWRPLI